MRNVAKLLTGKTSGAKIWLNSNNFGLTGNQLKAALANYALTATGAFSAFDLSTLQQYDAVFLAGDDITAAEQIALIMYVKAGGGLYIAAGTGTITGGGVGEAAQWNVILSEFSLNLADVYNLISGVLYTNSKSPILRGVTQLYYNNGNTVSVTGPGAQIITRDGTVGLIGVYSNSAVTP